MLGALIAGLWLCHVRRRALLLLLLHWAMVRWDLGVPMLGWVRGWLPAAPVVAGWVPLVAGAVTRATGFVVGGGGGGGSPFLLPLLLLSVDVLRNVAK